MNLSGFATRHIKAVLFVTITLCVIGAWLVRTFPVAILPDITFPRIVVVIDAGERPSRTVEAGITPACRRGHRYHSRREPYSVQDPARGHGGIRRLQLGYGYAHRPAAREHEDQRDAI